MTMHLRLAGLQDMSAVDALLARSFPRLLRPDYPPSVMVLALPVITRARPELLSSGRYFLVEDGEGLLVGAGGYSLSSPLGQGDTAAQGLGHIRHVATDPDHTRRGVGRLLMTQIVASAGGEGVTRFDCLSTRTAVPFYAAHGFHAIGPVDVPLRPGINFPAVRMRRDL